MNSIVFHYDTSIHASRLTFGNSSPADVEKKLNKAPKEALAHILVTCILFFDLSFIESATKNVRVR